MRIYQDKCDQMGFSATLRLNQDRTTDQKVGGSNPSERTSAERTIVDVRRMAT